MRGSVITSESGRSFWDAAALDFQIGRSTLARMNDAMTTTTFTLEGFRIVKTLGLVRGITVRSRSIVGNIGAALQTLVGGNISIYTELCEKARGEAFIFMEQHADAKGANGIVGVRYDATEVSPGVTEVLCYGTAVIVEPERPPTS